MITFCINHEELAQNSPETTINNDVENNEEYKAESIQVLKGLEAAKKLGCNIGDNDELVCIIWYLKL